MATTKYARQLASAQRTIKAKGVLVTWCKADNTNTTDDDAPEFPTDDPVKKYRVWMVFYAEKRQSLYSVLAQALTGSYKSQKFGVLAGGLKFTPEEGDAILLPDGSTIHVDALNITQPDLVPIVYEVDFR